MATSVVDLGQEESDDVVEVSGPAANPASIVDPGHGETKSADEFSGPAENPCLMARLRQRRLLAFVRGQRDGAFNALVHQASEQFCLERMQLLVTKGLWEDAVEYLNSFLPACPRSFGAQVFHNFILMHHYIASLVAGDQDALDIILADKWMRHVTYAEQTADQLVAPVMARYVLFMDNVRKHMDWEGVRTYAAHSLYRLAWQTPELNGRLTLPACHKMQHDVLSVVLDLSPRRHMKRRGPRLNPAAVARVIQGRRRYIRHLKLSTFETFDEAKEWLSTIVDDSLRCGIPIGGYLLQPSWREGDANHPNWKVPSCAGSLTVVNAEKIPEGCCTKVENALLGINPRKNLRVEQTVIDCFRSVKKLRTTGEFGEASMGRLNEIGAEG